MAFSVTIDAGKLSKCLRPSRKMPRNSGYLVKCEGAVGKDGVLQVLDELSRVATAAIADSFPFPQLFLFTNLIIVCSSTKIYEYVGGSLEEKLTVMAGSTWSAVDLYDCIYMSNGAVAVLRNPESNMYSITTDQPEAMALCNFQGQVLVGAPDVEGTYPGTSLTVNASPVNVSLSLDGTM